MGGQAPKKAPPAPEKPLKEQVKQMSREMNRLIRGFKRDEARLGRDKAKLQRELQKSLKKKEPKSCQISLAKQILRTQKFMDKFKRLQVQIENVDFQLQSVASVQAMSRVMGDMAKLMKNQGQKFNIQDMQHAMRVFNQQMQKGEMMNQRLQEMMDVDDEMDSDDQIEEIIKNAVTGTAKRTSEEDQDMEMKRIEQELGI